jgi:hypothetical protein
MEKRQRHQEMLLGKMVIHLKNTEIHVYQPVLVSIQHGIGP